MKPANRTARQSPDPAPRSSGRASSRGSARASAQGSDQTPAQTKAPKPAQTGSDPYIPGHGDPAYGVDHYALDLTYAPSTNHLSGTAQLALHTLDDTAAITFDLYGLKVTRVDVVSIGAPGVRAKGVGVNGVGAKGLRSPGARVKRWTHRGSRLTLRFADVVAAGSALTVTIRYAGSPRTMPGPDGRAGWEELTDGVIVAAQPHGAPTWFPCNDRADDKATYTIEMTTDAAYTVIAGGTLTQRRKVGRALRWTYEMTEPMSPYLATMQIGRYEFHDCAPPESGALESGVRGSSDSVELTIAAPPRLRGAINTAFADQRAMLDYFTSVFGDYPFATYAVVITDDVLEIPLESQAISTFGANHCTTAWDSQRLIAHELAHQWFGNTVTARRWSEIWLHEGFACYAEWLWSEQAGLDSAHQRAVAAHTRLRALPQDLVIGAPGATRMFDDRVYKRGALTLHALRRAVGDATFFEILRLWVGRYRGGSVTSTQFEVLCEVVACGAAPDGSASSEAVSGEIRSGEVMSGGSAPDGSSSTAPVSRQELRALFDAWLRKPALPQLP